jgi:hypothetical protein
MNELKPCPCGGVARLLYVNGESYGLHNGEKYTKVECSSCSFNASDTDDWNTRAPQSEWISVDDYLPDPIKTVLVTIINDATDGTVLEAIHQIDGDFLLQADLILKGLAAKPCAYVTHWMPLPLPPKESNQC